LDMVRHVSHAKMYTRMHTRLLVLLLFFVQRDPAV